MIRRASRLVLALAVTVTLAAALTHSGATPAEATVPLRPPLGEQGRLFSSNPDAGDRFGSAVAISGDTMVVGAIAEDSSANGGQSDNSTTTAGAAYVFLRTNGAWTQQAYLKASNADFGDGFGWAVGIDGDTIVVGAWGEQSNGTGQADNSANNSGAAYVFTRTNGVWSQQAYLKATHADQDDMFGFAVGISGDTVVVAAPGEGSNSTVVNGIETDNSAAQAGAAYVYTRSGSVWTKQAYLKAANAQAQDTFGESVSISGDSVVVGAMGEASNATGVNQNASDNSLVNAGAAYVFARAAGSWSQQAYLKASNTDQQDNFGISVSLSGDLVVVGARYESSAAAGVNASQTNDSAHAAGAAYVFRRTSGSWVQEVYLKASNAEAGDEFGLAVAVSGESVAVGAHWEDGPSAGVNRTKSGNGVTHSGATYLFSSTSHVWTQLAYVKPSAIATDQEFGFAVALSGQTLAVGAPINAASQPAGATYVFGTPCTKVPFADVATTNPFCPEIEWLKETGITTGFGDGTFHPADNVTRQAMAAFVARLDNGVLTACTTPPFSDVPVNHPFCPQIKWMKTWGYTTGFGDGTFRPAEPVTRRAMSAFMARYANATLTSCAAAPFSDVPTSHPFCREIKWMAAAGVSTGFSDGTFRPSDPVTRQAMAAFLYREPEAAPPIIN
jgi:hypothetical protein